MKVLMKQTGVTLIELIIAIAIAAVLLAGIVTVWRTATNINRNTNNETNATNQLKNAFNYISRDADQAGLVSTASSNFPLTLGWGQNTATPITVIYSINANGALQRSYTDSSGSSTMNVANNVNSNAAKTNCTWDAVNHDLTINMTISIGSINAARQFIITPRVIQASSQQPDTTTLTSSTQSTPYGQVVMFTATISVPTDSGTVTFLYGSNPIGVSPVFLTGNNGTATYPVTSLPVGAYPIIAVYSGDAVYEASTSLPLNLTVTQGTPTLSVANPTTVPYSGSPQTATINSSVAGTVSNVLYNGSATVPTSVGTYAVTANFVPTDTVDYLSLTNASAGNFIISKASPAVSLTSSQNPSAQGQSITFTATISISTATGTITFKDNGVTLTPNGVVTITSGVSAYTYTTSALSSGNHPITAVYSGDNNDNAYTGSLTQQINTVSMGLTSSIASVSAVKFTATVTGSGPTPGGTVQFKVNGANYGNAINLVSGSATSNSITPNTTVQTITAVYSGDTNYNSITSINYYLVVFNPSADSYVNSASTSTNYGNNASLYVRGGSTTNNTLVQFTLTSLAGETIDRASLALNRTGSNNANITAYTVNKNWIETQLTWIYATTSPSVKWTTGGGDYSGAGITITTASGWNYWTVTSNVASFITGNNFGWLLKTSNNSTVTFSSKEGTNSPQLIIAYH